MIINNSANKINLPDKINQKKAPDNEEVAINKYLEPEDMVFIGKPKLMREASIREAFSVGVGAALDPIGLATEGTGDIHKNSVRSVAEHIVKGNPKEYDMFGTDGLIGLGAGIAVGLAINVATYGMIPIVTGLIDGFSNLPKLWNGKN